MKLSDIKRGDILVAQHNDTVSYQFERDYIIFIADGSKIFKGCSNGDYTSYDIPVIAAIDLENDFMVDSTIGFTKYSRIEYKTTTLRKPTLNEMLDILNRLKENGYKYYRKNKLLVKQLKQ